MSAKNRILAKEWFDRAGSDLKYATAGEKETGEHHVTCFLCHQAAEKILKGLIVLDGGTPQKTHNLNLLLSSLLASYSSLSAMAKDLRKLDKYYIPARYPGGMLFKFTADDSKFALSIVQGLSDIAKAESST